MFSARCSLKKLPGSCLSAIAAYHACKRAGGDPLNARGRKLGTFTEKASAISDDGSNGCVGGEALIAQAYERASRTLLERVLPDIATN